MLHARPSTGGAGPPFPPEPAEAPRHDRSGPGSGSWASLAASSSRSTAAQLAYRNRPQASRNPNASQIGPASSARLLSRSSSRSSRACPFEERSVRRLCSCLYMSSSWTGKTNCPAPSSLMGWTPSSATSRRAAVRPQHPERRHPRLAFLAKRSFSRRPSGRIRCVSPNPQPPEGVALPEATAEMHRGGQLALPGPGEIRSRGQVVAAGQAVRQGSEERRRRRRAPGLRLVRRCDSSP